MSKGVLIGGIIGGIVMFLWGAISHMLLPIGTSGMKAIPEEAKVVSVLRSAISEAGLYVFPWEEPGKENEGAQAGASQGPLGFLVYTPQGGWKMTSTQFIVELLSDIACALIAGALLCKARSALPGFAKRVLFVALLGLLPWLAISLSNWNWYHFPRDYFLAEGLDQVMGFALTGLVLAATVKGDEPAGIPASP